MDPDTTAPTAEAEPNSERRQLRDVNGNPVFRDEDDTRVLLSHTARYTAWNSIAFAVTLPLYLLRLPSMLRHPSFWTAPDPTVVVPSGPRDPRYSPKWDDEPRPEPR